MRELELRVVYRPVDELKPNPRNARTHSKKQIAKLAAAIREFGFLTPIIVDADGRILAGHGRVEAANLVGLPTVPTIQIAHLTDAQTRLFAIADNQIAALAGWDAEILAAEFRELSISGLDLSVELTGFDTAEIDAFIDGPVVSLPTDPADQVPLVLDGAKAVTRLGDLWMLGGHRLFCGDTREESSYARILDGENAQMVFIDPPYNVKIRGHVSGLGRAQHREFPMASGEMSDAEFLEFLRQIFRRLVHASTDGSIHYVCIDWRHVFDVLAAGRDIYRELKNIVVWAKTNGGMGAFYRSQHEFIAVFKNGTAPHVNNFGLGENGRYRSNLWTYAGANTFRAGRDEDLATHPTVKPVALVADAIRDCSRRNDIILDAFGGSGTTLIAAEKTGRLARLIELDPLYVDATIRRWQALTGQQATHSETGRSFDQTERAPLGEFPTGRVRVRVRSDMKGGRNGR